MQIGIHTFAENKIAPFERRYEQILSFNEIQSTFLHINQADFWDKLNEVDVFISRWIDTSDHEQIGHTVLPIIDTMDAITCLPSYSNFWPYDDKIRQYYLLKQHGFPVIETYVFWDKKSALNWIETASLPTVFKLKGGAGSSNVVLIKTRSQGRRLIRIMFGSGVKSGKLPTSGHVKFKQFDWWKTIRRMGGNFLKTLKGIEVDQRWQLHKNYALFQRFLPGNTFDVRVAVIGGRAFAFRRMNRENDFRASGSGNADFDTASIDLQCVRIALDVTKKLKYHTMSYDFLYGKDNKPLISEMSYTFVDNYIFRCPGYWDDQLEFHEGRYWPQYLQLMDLLDKPDLLQPDMAIEETSIRQRFQRLA